jgi:hypothetical protein
MTEEEETWNRGFSSLDNLTVEGGRKGGLTSRGVIFNSISSCLSRAPIITLIETYHEILLEFKTRIYLFTYLSNSAAS